MLTDCHIIIICLPNLLFIAQVVLYSANTHAHTQSQMPLPLITPYPSVWYTAGAGNEQLITVASLKHQCSLRGNFTAVRTSLG